MAGTLRRPSPSVGALLWREPYRFDFFQAVRLLERMQAHDSRDPQAGAVGIDELPSRELVRFRSLVSLAFPPNPVVALERASGQRETAPAEMTVSFMGLHGPAGVLPRHYTAHLLDRCHVRNKDYAQRDFFDLFNHRAISLFYRAWEKYRFAIGYEHARQGGANGQDLFTFCLLALVGLGTSGLSNRIEPNDQSIIFYGGHFAHWPRNASSLQAILQDHFELPAEVLQFSGQWLYLSREDQSSLPGRLSSGYTNCRLGVDVIVGERVWDVQSKFRIRIGPLSYKQFSRMMPEGDILRPLCQMTRLYAQAQFDFDVQPVLAAQEVPDCQLNTDPARVPRLGWNTWLKSQPFAQDAHDAVFALPTI